jgi:chain length determinant protein EpsF
MTFRQFLMILRARKWAVIGMVIFGVVLSVALSLVLPPRYKATSSVLIDYKGMDPLSGLLLPMMPGYMSTQFDIIQSHRVALKVVRNLKLTENPIVKQDFLDSTGGNGRIDDWLADLILDKLDVKPTRDSNVIDIVYTSPDPKFAAILADSFAKAYIDTNLELRVAPAKDSAIWFDEQIKQLRENLTTAQAKLSAYQREKGFSAADERLDVESAKLGETSAQLVNAQATLSDSTARKRQLEDFVASGRSPETLPDILGNALIQNLKAQVTIAESKREQISAQLGKNHPEYIRSTAEVESLRQKLAEEIRNLESAINNTYRLSQKRVEELLSATATQKSKMLNLNQGRDDMAVLIKEVDNAQRALDAANSRLTQENLQSRSSQTNVMVLSSAVPPLKPSFPKFMLNIPIGIFAGLFLGINLAFLREYFDRRIRSVEDLRETTGLVVLGTLDRASRRTRQRRLLFSRGGKTAERTAKAAA